MLYEVKIEQVKRPEVAGNQAHHLWFELPGKPPLSYNNQTTMHPSSHSFICTAQVVLNTSVTHLAVTQSVCPVTTSLGVDQISSIQREHMVSGFHILLRASLLMLEIKRFRCYELKIEETGR